MRETMMKKLIMTNNSFRILQLTDLHLMNLPTDEETYSLITNVMKETKPDFIIITGDITMTYDHQHLLIRLRDFLDGFLIPWTFTFGNHDHEGSLSLIEQAELMMAGKYCYFEKGNPNIKGCGNHYLPIYQDDQHIALLGFLDSHNDRIDDINGVKVWSYDYLEQNQIDDAIQTIDNYKQKYPRFSSLFFFHIPLTEYKSQIENYKEEIIGDCFEPISCSKYDSQFFPQLLKTETLKGIFTGHDHVCDFSFQLKGCLLAFGRCSGHYNYTMPEFTKGARITDLKGSGEISSWVWIEK